MYDTLLLIDPASIITVDQIASSMRKQFEQKQLSTSKEGKLTISFGDFVFKIYFVEEPHVLVESQELALYFAKNRPEQAPIAQCASRIEISATDDPYMDRFNDYCFLLEAIEKLGKVYTFDSAQANFVNLI